MGKRISVGELETPSWWLIVTDRGAAGKTATSAYTNGRQKRAPIHGGHGSQVPLVELKHL